MHAKLTAVAVCLLTLVWSGCVTNSTKMNSVHLGMTKEDLLNRMGKPHTRSGQDNVEYLTYYMSNDSSPKEQPYMVRLIDGKVESFGRFVQLLDTHGGNSSGTAPLGIGAIMPYAMNMDVVTQLQHLKALQDQGVLTADEVARAKERLFAKKD